MGVENWVIKHVGYIFLYYFSFLWVMSVQNNDGMLQTTGKKIENQYGAGNMAL